MMHTKSKDFVFSQNLKVDIMYIQHVNYQLKQESEKLWQLLEEVQSVGIATHLNPDGDGIGSMLAMGELLNAMGKSVTLLCNDKPPTNLMFLPNVQDIIHGEEAENCKTEFDVGIILDLNNTTRLGKAKHAIEKSKKIVVIDHHEQIENGIEGLLIIHPEYSATALIIYEIYLSMNVTITPSMAQYLLTGIATDTGNFRFGNTSPQAMRASADLLERGGDIVTINLEVWEKKPLPALKLLGRALSNLKSVKNGKLVYSTIKFEDYQETDADDELTEGIVSEIGKTDGVEVFMLLREPKKGKIRASVRSRGAVDVAEICSKFGGGGHKQAAGCTFDGSLQDAEKQLISELEKVL